MTPIAIEPDDARDQIRFFSNANKKEREKWVIENWCRITGRIGSRITKGEAPDYVVNEEGVEIVEVLLPDRKRHDECKMEGLAQPCNAGSLERTVAQGHLWLLKIIDAKAKKYGSGAKGWVLLLYVNFSFWQRIDWDFLKSKLAATQPQFKRVDALTADGQTVVTLFNQIGDNYDNQEKHQ